MLYTISLIMLARELKLADGPAYPLNMLNTRIMDTMSITLGFGDAPSAKLYEEKPEPIRNGEWVVFVFAMFIVTILILNTLIAILGDR